MKLWHLISGRTLLVIGLTILIIGALIYGFMPKPVAVDIEVVKRGPFQVILEEEGKTRLKDRFEISAPVDGTLCRLDWDVGDSVKAGQKLCEIAPLKSVLLDPRSKADAKDRVAAAQAALLTAQAKVTADAAEAEYAQAEYRRLKEIYDKKLISRSQLEKAEAEKRRTQATLQSTRFTVQSAHYALQEAKNALSHFAAEGGEMQGEKVAIHAPIDGQIMAIYQDSEGTVTSGQALMDIGNTRALEMVVEVLSADAVRIRLGMPVKFNRWGGEKPLTGTVRVIEPAGFTKVSALGVEEQRVNVIIDITSPREQWERLGDAYRVDAQFILWQGEDVLQIPESALFRYADGWAVFVATAAKKAELRRVTLGKRSGLRAQISDGLKAGEQVITHPDESIEAGVAVRVTGQ